MISIQFIYYKQQLAQWLLTAAFIICSFAFSGYTNTPQFIKQPLRKTELVGLYNKNTSEQTVLYKAGKCTRTAIPARLQNKLLVLSLCNRLIKAKLKNITKLFRTIKTTCYFFQLKTIPQYPVENFLITKAG